MLNQYAVDYPTFPVNQRYSHFIVILAGCSAVLEGMLSRNDKPPDIWDTHGKSGNVFVNLPASSSSLYPGGFNPWISNVTEDISPHVTSERQNPDTALDPRYQSGPSARNSFDLMDAFRRIMGQNNNDCRFRIFTLTNSLLQQHLLVGR